MYARARAGERTSPADSATFTVRPANRVEWQVVDRNATPHPAGWQDASGFSAWQFGFDTATYGPGAHTLVTRLVSGGAVLSQTTAAVRFQ